MRNTEVNRADCGVQLCLQDALFCSAHVEVCLQLEQVPVCQTKRYLIQPPVWYVVEEGDALMNLAQKQFLAIV